MPESERLARIDQVARFEIWCQTHNPAQYMQYLSEESARLNALADPSAITTSDKAKIHLTRGSLLELLNTMKEVGYTNEGLAMFHIDIIVYRIQAIWRAEKK